MTCFVPRKTQALAQRTQFLVSVAALLGRGLLDYQFKYCHAIRIKDSIMTSGLMHVVLYDHIIWYHPCPKL